MPANRRRRPPARGSSPRPTATAASAATVTRPALRPTGILLRFVSCGVLAIVLGLVWKATLAPRRVGVGSALLGILFLLAGFIVGGLSWYLRDARLRLRDPALVDDERIIFSFVVFALVPFAVLVFVGVIWVVALLVGGAG